MLRVSLVWILLWRCLRFFGLGVVFRSVLVYLCCGWRMILFVGLCLMMFFL